MTSDVFGCLAREEKETHLFKQIAEMRADIKTIAKRFLRKQCKLLKIMTIPLQRKALLNRLVNMRS